MSEHSINLMTAIESGDQEAMDAAFNAAIGAKLGDALDAKKIEVAKAIYGQSQSEEEPSDTEDEIETSDGTEEV